jgi:hypothetical protein
VAGKGYICWHFLGAVSARPGRFCPFSLLFKAESAGKRTNIMSNCYSAPVEKQLPGHSHPQILGLAVMQNEDLAAASPCRHCGLDLYNLSKSTRKRHGKGICMRSSRPLQRRVALVAEVEVNMFCQCPRLHTSLLFAMLQHLTPCSCRATPSGRAAAVKGSLKGYCQTMN